MLLSNTGLSWFHLPKKEDLSSNVKRRLINKKLLFIRKKMAKLTQYLMEQSNTKT